MANSIHENLATIRGFKYLAIDPGKMNGWALFDTGGYLRDAGQTDNLYKFLRKLDPKPEVIIFEDYVINPRIRQGGTRPVAAIAIGHLEAYCEDNNIQLVKQYATNKTMGYVWAEIKQADDHKDSHQRDAIAHGTYYLIRNRIRPVIRTTV